MIVSRDEIESLISKAEQDDKLEIAIKEIEIQIFKEEVDLYSFLLNVIRIYAYLLYFWKVKMPTRRRIREKLEKMITETTNLLEEYRNPDEMIILENEYVKTDLFNTKRNFSLRQKELEQDLQLYNRLLDNIPSKAGGPNPKPSYKDIVQLLLPFFQKNKNKAHVVYGNTRKHGDTNVYPGDDTTFVMRVMPLLNKIDSSIKLVKESSIGGYIITLNEAKKKPNS